MADRLSIEITAQVAQALAGLKEVAAAVTGMETSVKAANASGAQSSNVLKTAVQDTIMAFRTAPSAGAAFKDLAVIGQTVATTFGGNVHDAVTKVGGAIKTHLETGVKNAVSALNGLDQTIMNVGANLLKSFGPLMGIAAGLAIAVGISSAISATMRWDDEVAKLSRSLQGNVVAASTWKARAEAVGIDADKLTLSFQRFNNAIIAHSSEFTKMGIAVVDGNGKLRSTNDILNDSVGWFQRYRGSALATHEAITLFGRGSADLAALLGMTKAQMQALDQEAMNMGLIIGAEQLAHWRAFDAEVKTAGFSVKALELALGHGLMPVFSILAQAIASFIAQHLKELVHWLATTTSFVLGLLSSLFGIKFQFSDFAAAISDVGGRVAALGTAEDLAGQASKSAAAALRDQTQALQNQIAALTQKNQLQQEATDKEIALLEAQAATQAFDAKKLQSTQRLADDQKNITKLQSQYQQYLLIGDLGNAQMVYDQITAAQQQMTNDQLQMATDESDRERQLQIQALRDTQKTNTDKTNDLVTNLQNRMRAISQADTSSNAGLLSGASSTANAFNKTWNSAGKDFATGLSASAAQAGADMATKIKTAMATIQTLLDPGQDPKTTAARNAAWQAVGDAMAKALIVGMVKALANFITQPMVDAWNAFWHALTNPGTAGSTHPNPKGFAFATGGMVPGPVGAPVLATVHGGERILTPQQQREGGGGGGQTNYYVTQHIHGSPDVEKTAKVVVAKLRVAFGRQ